MHITTIITSLNSKKWIAGAIDSFLIQEYKDKELIIFDGMSTDGTHEIIDDYTKKHPDLIKWINEKDQGISDARNKAIAHASGDYIGFLGADDRLLPGIYGKMKEYLELSLFDEVELFYFDSYFRYQDKFFKPRTIKGFLSSQIKFRLVELLYYLPLAPGEAFYYNRKIFDKKKFNIENKNTMDYEFNLEICQNSKNKYISIPFFGVINYIVDGISAKQEKNQFISAIKLQFKYSRAVMKIIPIFYILRYLALKTALLIEKVLSFITQKNKF